MLFCAWHYGGEDPYRLYNMLDEDYRPLWKPALGEERPKFPERVRNFMYACGRVAAIIEGKMKDTRAVSTKKTHRERDAVSEGGVVLPAGSEDARSRDEARRRAQVRQAERTAEIVGR